MAYTSTPTHGKTARAEKNDTAIDYVGEWSLNFNLDMADHSRQGQSWKEGTPGQAGGTGSLRGSCVLGNTEQKALHDNLVTATPGTKLTDMKFLVDGSTEGWSGNLYVTSMVVSAGVGDVVTIAFDFQLDGAWSVSDSQ